MTRKKPKSIKEFFPVIKKEPAIAWGCAFFCCLIIILMNQSSASGIGGDADEFEVGKVAGRDVYAERSISYRDEDATRLKIEAQEQLVPAVFHFSYPATNELRNRWDYFASLAVKYPADDNAADENSANAFKLAIQSEFPGDFADDALERLYLSEDRADMLADCQAILDALLTRGIYSLPEDGLERLNLGVVELIRQSGSRIEQEMVPLRSVISADNTVDAVSLQIALGAHTSSFEGLAPLLLDSFLAANVFYSAEDTARRIVEATAQTEPVTRNIERGKRIIRKGFVITEEEMTEFEALRIAPLSSDFPVLFAQALFLLLVFGLLYYFCGSRIIGRNLSNSEIYLVSALSVLYIAGSVMINNISFNSMPAAVLLPSALLIMLPSILIHARLALLLAMTLPLASFLSGVFDVQSYIFALVSGVVAAYTLQGAEKRMDLVKAGLLIAAANLAAMVAILLWQRSPAGEYPASLFWAAFNGVASGMLVLGLLPPLEHALNAATSFRLIELSDLNTPVLRRLFTAAPGTYSHSIMVANLAEAACQDIGANPLLARVGAYYHDMGKMENPEYFVENQENHNPHDTMAPRLSATVIRSHVKLGMEKARQLGLPREVIDIIGEHHGNSVITWFYSKALKQEGGDSKKGAVDVEDFSYPGTPPRTRESAVVMLADMAEAAVRTMDKPTAVKIEKFIQELISQKVEHGQLSLSELTFRDTETIKNAFVRVLTGYYHTRIEYPKIDEQTPAKENAASGAEEAKEK